LVRRALPTLLAAAALLGAATPAPAATGLADQRTVAGTARASEGATGPIAPTSACPGQTRLDAPAAVQVEAMRCMTAYARGHAGLPGLAPVEQLDGSATAKAGDILDCGDFSHSACGREFTYWIEASGYLADSCWRVGENLAWGIGEEGTVRSIFRAWMASPGHRQNILGNFAQLGLALRVGSLEGLAGTRVWAQHFGSHCAA
jgi:uncharacterized protein YkwD